jgi:hypothetical protein
MKITNPQRNAFFIQQLARHLTEGQLADLTKATQDAMGYGDRVQPAPQLSQVQQGLCDWLCQDAFREAADERLNARVAVAEEMAKTARESVYNATRGFELVKKSADRLRNLTKVTSEAFQEMDKLLADVPPPKDRY